MIKRKRLNAPEFREWKVIPVNVGLTRLNLADIYCISHMTYIIYSVDFGRFSAINMLSAAVTVWDFNNRGGPVVAPSWRSGIYNMRGIQSEAYSKAKITAETGVPIANLATD